MNTAVMFSKASDEWSTPPGFYSALAAEFVFMVDAAATHGNRKCPTYFGPDRSDPYFRDSLTVPWADFTDRVWLNPPYSRCAEFMAKADEERAKGVTTVALVPARTDTKWFHGHLWNSAQHRPLSGIELRFIRGRLKFGDGKNSAPFPSMVVVFRP